MDDAARLVGAQNRLRDRMLFWMPEEGDYGSTLLPGFTASRRNSTHVCNTQKGAPTIELVVQGKKQLVSAGKEYFCAESGYLMHGLEPSGKSQILAVSPETPYLSISISFNRSILRRFADISPVPLYLETEEHAIHAAVADYWTLDAFSRLMHLIAQPDLFFLLGPLIVREIHYRMLTGEGNCKPVIGLV